MSSIPLAQFERHVSPKVLKRGQQYYDDGNIVEIMRKEDDEEEWYAEVEGSDGGTYEVFVSMDGENIDDWECDCPYDWEPLCKHVVAVLYEIRDTLTLEKARPQPAAAAEPPGKTLHRPLSELLDAFTQLPEAEQQVLLIGALFWEPFPHTRISEIFPKAGLTWKKGKLTAPTAKEALDRLAAQGFLTRRRADYVCEQPIAHELCERFLKPGETWRTVISVIRGQFPFGYFIPQDKGHRIFREMRFARYLEQPEVFQERYFTLVNYYYAYHTQESLCAFWLPQPFDRERVERLPPAIRDFLLSEKLTLQTFALSPADAYFFYAVDRAAGNPLLARLCGQLFLFRGEWGAVERLIKNFSETARETFTGIRRLQQGDSGAVDSFAAATKTMRRETRRSKEVLHHLDGVFHVLALLKLQDASRYPHINDYLGRALKTGTSYAPVFTWLEAVLLSLQNEKAAARQRLISPKGMDDFFLFFGFLCQYWVDDQLVDRRGLASYQKRLQKNGYAWMAAEMLALWNALEPGDATREKALADQLAVPGVEPLINLLPRLEEWETALTLLAGIGSGHRAKSESDSRLAWLVDFEIKWLAPKEQTFGKNGWTKGRAVAFQRLSQEDVAGMTDQDRRIVKAIGYGSYSEFSVRNDQVWKELVGHPLLFLRQSPEVAVQLLEVKPSLLVRKVDKGYQVQFSQPVSQAGVTIVKETPTRYLLINATDEMIQIAYALNGKSLFVPRQGAERLKAVVAGLSAAMPVQSVFEEEDLPAVEPDSRIHIHLLPVGDGFQVELFVKPFRDAPPYVKPGEGEAHLVALLDGQRTRVTRDLKAEKKEVSRLRKRVELLGALPARQGIWDLNDTEQCLELLLQLAPLIQAGDVILEWPKGEKLRITHVVGFDQLRLQIRERNNWFEVSGDLPVDEEKVLTMQELLALSERNSQFVELSNGQFLALTRELRSRLRQVNGLISAGKKGGPLQFHALAAPALDGFIGGLKQVKTDKAFKEAQQRLRQAFAQTFSLPKNFNATLRPYQQEGFEWLRRCAAWGVGACLADDMGLGKTIEALAFLTDRASQGPALVVAPASVCRNWQSETGKFAPALQPILFGEGDRAATIEAAGPGDLLIVTYDLLARESEHFIPKKFATVVLDEAQAIKNRATRRSETAMQLQGDFRMILTGTPLENHLGELWNLFQFINPGLLGSLDHFNERFAVPIEKYRDEERRDQLRRLVQPFILRRRKDEVLKDLPPKTEITLTVELSPEERAFYEALRRHALETLTADTDSAAGEKHLRILAEIMRLRRAACHPKLVDEQAGFTSSAKLRLFREIVEELRDNGHKALVFSQFVGHLQLLEDHLKREKIPYQYLDGQTPLAKRQQRIEAFQAGEGDLFLISLKAGGVGLNLTAADYVIHVDPWWNPAVEDQATDRAHRIGQDKPVTVYRLVAEGTIEEKILALHEHKRDLADSLLAGADVSARLSAEDLLDLMTEVI